MNYDQIMQSKITYSKFNSTTAFPFDKNTAFLVLFDYELKILIHKLFIESFEKHFILHIILFYRLPIEEVIVYRLHNRLYTK